MQSVTNSCRNILTSLPLHLAQVASNFIVRTFFIASLSEACLGIDGVLGNVLTLLSISECGLNTSLVYSLYAPLEKGDRQKTAALVRYGQTVFYWISLGILLVTLAASPLVPHLFPDAGLPVWMLLGFYGLKVSTVMITYQAAASSALISADEKEYLVRRIYGVANLSRSAVQILVLLLFRSYWLFLGADVISSLVCVALLVRCAKKTYALPPVFKPLTAVEKKALFANTGSLFCYKISSLVLCATDTLLASCLLSTITAGYYSLYATLQTSITGITNTFFSGIVHSVGRLNIHQSQQSQKATFEFLQALMTGLAIVVTVCFCALANQFIALWAGETRVLGMGIVLAIGLTIYMTIVFYPVDMYRQTTDMFHKTKWMALLCAGVNLALSIGLAGYCGLFGILIATSISRAMTVFWFEPVMLYRFEFGQAHGCRRFFVQSLMGLLITADALLFSLAIFSEIPLEGWPALVVCGLLAFAASLFCAAIYVLWTVPVLRRLLWQRLALENIAAMFRLQTPHFDQPESCADKKKASL